MNLEQQRNGLKAYLLGAGSDNSPFDRGMMCGAISIAESAGIITTEEYLRLEESIWDFPENRQRIIEEILSCK